MPTPTILIVDDSSFSVKVISKALGPLGAKLVTACDGDEGLEAYRREQPDVVLLDLLMPNKDGFDVLEQLHKLDPDHKTIVVSADIQDASRERAMSLGAIAFINKPFEAASVIAAVQSVLGSPAVAGN